MRLFLTILVFLSWSGWSAEWGARFGSTSADSGRAVALDASGNVYMAGFFNGTINLGSTNLVSISTSDIVLAKYSSAGVLQWAERIGGSGGQTPMGLAIDASGNIIMTGDFTGTTDLGGGPIATFGGQDIFLAKYSSTGTFIWAQHIGGPNDDPVTGVAVDSGGNIVITGGSIVGIVDFGGITGHAFTGNTFVARYSSAGTCLWAQVFSSTGGDNGNSIAIDTSSNIVVAGGFAGKVTIQTNVLTSAGGTDIYLSKFSPSGTNLWANRYGGVHGDTATAVALDAGNNIYLAGWFIFTTDLGSGTLTSPFGTLNSEPFLAKYLSSGTPQWSTFFSGPNSEQANCITVDPNTNIWVGGFFQATLNIGGVTLTNKSAQNIFVAQYTSAGTYLWSTSLSGSGLGIGIGIVADSTYATMTGEFTTTGTFGGQTLVSAGSWDGFTYHFTPAVNTPPSITQQPGSTNAYAGQVVSFSVAASGSPPLHYQWSTNSVNTGSNSPSLTVGPCLLSWSGMSVACVITNLFGSVTSSTATLTVRSATNYFVDGLNGNDGNTGTSWAQAFQTQQKAANSVTNGDAVTVTNNHWFTERVILKTSQVTWIGLGATNWGFEGNPGVDSQSISGFYVHNTNTYGGGIANDRFSGIYCQGSSWVISNNFCWENGVYGIWVDGRTNAGWPVVANNLVVNNLSWTNGLAGINLSGHDSIALSNDIAGSVRFTIYCTNPVCSSDADGIYPFGYNLVIRSNYIHGININDPKNAPIGGCPGDDGAHPDGVQSFAAQMGNPNHDILVDANVIDGTINGVMVSPGNGVFTESCSNWWVINNVIRYHRGGSFGSSVTPSYSMNLINNTLIGQTNDAMSSRSIAVAFALGKCTNAVWENNICFNWTNTQLVPNAQFSGLTSWKNMKYRDDGVPVSEDSSYTPWIVNDFENINPKLSSPYANPPAPLLLSNSPAIDVGFVQITVTNDLIGTHRPVNNKWDLGAVEFPATNAPVIVQQPTSTNTYATQTALFTIGVNGSVPLSYQWKTNGVVTGTNGPALSIPNCLVAWSGMSVVCVVTNLVGSVTSATATLTVLPDPVINTQPSNATVGVGSTASFSVTATGQSTLSYQWNKNGGAIGGATSSSYTTPATVAGDNNSHFTVTVTDNAGSLLSATATLTVTNIISPPDPVITAQPQSTNIFATQSAVFRIAATGGSTLAYQWKTNGINTGTNGPALAVGPAPVTWNGMAVLCVVSDLAGSATSSTATLTVGADPVITSQPQNVTVQVGQVASFSVTATGQTALSYQWSRNGVSIGGETGSTYTTPTLTTANNGDSYYCDVTDSAGTLRSATATLTVFSPPSSLARITNLHVGQYFAKP